MATAMDRRLPRRAQVWRCGRAMVVLVAVSLSVGSVASADGTEGPRRLTDAEFATLYAGASNRVFRVNVSAPAGPRHGSAVLLEVVGDTGYFATCYHVLYEASGVRISNQAGDNVGDNAGAKFYVDRAHDVAIIRLPLKAGVVPPPAALAAAGAALPIIRAEARAGDEMLALGFAGFQQEVIESRVRLGRTGDAARIFSPDRPSLQYLVRPMLDEATSPGMSGGPVVDGQWTLAGLVVGRLPDTAGFLIPADLVSHALAAAKKADAALPSRAAAGLDQWPEKPYDDKFVSRLHAEVNNLNNVRRWDLASEWRALLGDTLNAREPFQEVRLDLGKLRPNTGGGSPRFGLRVNAATFLAAGGRVKVWVNGEAKVVTAGAQGKDAEVDLSGKLVPGENLIVLNRSLEEPGTKDAKAGRDDIGGFRVNRLFEAIPLQLAVTLDGEPAYTIHRELPAIIPSYSVYLTLTAPPGEHKASPRAPRGHNAYVAVNLNRLAELMNRRPGGYVGPFRDAMGVSYADVQLDPAAPFIEFERVSDQALKVRGRASATFSNFVANYAGLTLRKKKPTRSEVWAELVVQGLRTEQDGGPFRAAARFVGGGVKSFALPLGADGDFDLDLGALAAEFLLARLNDQFQVTEVQPEKGKPIDPAAIRAVAEFALPGLLPPNVEVVFDRFRVDPSGWLIVTLAVRKAGTDWPSTLHEEMPTAPDTPGDRNALAVLVSDGVPADASAAVLAGLSGGTHPALSDAAARAAGKAIFRLAAKPDGAGAGKEAKPVIVRPGRAGDWADALRAELAGTYRIESSFKAPAGEVFAAAVAGVKGFSFDTPAGDGEVSITMADDRLSLAGKALALSLASLQGGSVKADVAQITAEGLDLSVPTRLGERAAEGRASGDTVGKVTLNRLSWGDAHHAENVHADFKVGFDEKAPPGDVHVQLSNISGKFVVSQAVDLGPVHKTVDVPVPIPSGSADLTVDHAGAVSGRAEFGDAKARLVLEFADGRVTPKFQSNVVDDAKKLLGDVGGKIEDAAHKVEDTAKDLGKKIRKPFGG